ncbi:hypothetical protein, partial [Streptococcus agalactiae]|uniref:hypothetical protein n=1 Tax=Streptococcus agalactiae TaxID=1311 RepID=UPI000DD9E2AF
MTSELTWEQAKSETQAMEREIVELIPADLVTEVDQFPTGSLLSCDADTHSWTGRSVVAVAPGTNLDETLALIADHYEQQGVTVAKDTDVNGDARVQLQFSNGANYLISHDAVPRQLNISSGSPCFTLPEGVYP